jgi:hypothetical protein
MLHAFYKPTSPHFFALLTSLLIGQADPLIPFVVTCHALLSSAVLSCADVTLNTHPPTHTPNMFSWFPIYFPLKEPITLRPGDPVIAHVWRKCGAHKVWYEWAVSQPAASHIHNTGGRSYYVGL